jgi:hypothetical protein
VSDSLLSLSNNRFHRRSTGWPVNGCTRDSLTTNGLLSPLEGNCMMCRRSGSQVVASKAR